MIPWLAGLTLPPVRPCIPCGTPLNLPLERGGKSGRLPFALRRGGAAVLDSRLCGNDGVVLEGDFAFGFYFGLVDFVAEAGFVGDG